MKITDVAGLKAAIAAYIDDRFYKEVFPLLTDIDKLIDSFTVKEPLTVGRIMAKNIDIFLDTCDLRMWLEEHEYDGLWNEEGEPHCGCSFREGDDNWLCGDGCPYPDCRPAYRHKDGCMYLEPEEKKDA